MQLNVTLRTKKLILLVTVFHFVHIGVYAQSESSDSKKTPVILITGGDDGLTSRFVDALEKAFHASQNFTIDDTCEKQETLLVTIPTHLKWEELGEKIKVYYIVKISSIYNETPSGGTTNACSENLLHAAFRNSAADLLIRVCLWSRLSLKRTARNPHRRLGFSPEHVWPPSSARIPCFCHAI